MDMRSYLEEKRKLVEAALDRLLPPEGERPEEIHKSMRYSVFCGGKRLRPILCLAAVEALGKDPLPALPAACALELVHTYSLVHDDLPCMDDDDIRRGKPTTHRVFGEAVALLAGDALLSQAFVLISTMDAVPAGVVVELTRLLSRSCGSAGLVGGQAADLAAEGKMVDSRTLEYIHSRKTAALIETAVLFGAVLGGTTSAQRGALSTYGRSLGMAFQITDDILDVTGNEQMVGKRLGKDERARKATYPALFGLEVSRARACGYIDRALAALDLFDEKAEPLREIARSIVGRER